MQALHNTLKAYVKSKFCVWKCAKEVLKVIFPAKWLAFVDFYLSIMPKDSLGGGFNGQIRRREIFFDLNKALSFNALVETGSLRGSTSELLSTQTNAPLYAVEINPRHYYYTSFRLQKNPNARIFLGDSVSFLKRLQNDRGFPKRDVFFYLDAHWLNYLPLRDELEIIAKNFAQSVIMIDDFQVPDDPGYGFDDYGPGKKLCLEYLQLETYTNLKAFFPAAHSSTETGARRGCVVLVTKGAAFETIKKIKSLRPYDTTSFSLR